MDRLILRHLDGAHVHQDIAVNRAEFGAPILLGRDPACRIVVDESADQASRRHACIQSPDGQGRVWQLTDLNSANGSFVNGVRVTGPRVLAHGDTIGLGVGGPRLAVAFDPAPAELRATRRVPSLNVAAVLPVPRFDAAADASSAVDGRVGRATVQRLLGASLAEATRAQRQGLRKAAWTVAALGALGTGLLMWQQQRSDAELGALRQAADQQQAQSRLDQERLQGDVQALRARAELPARLKAEYGPSVVWIQVAWRLTDTLTGLPMYHRHAAVKEGGPPVPLYTRDRQGRLEPVLTTDRRPGAQPIAASVSGTGFVVGDKGQIMTNRHVAAAWNSVYDLPFPGALVQEETDAQGSRQWTLAGMLEQPTAELARWVPARSSYAAGRGVNDASSPVTGVNSAITVTFAGSRTRIPAMLSAVSADHDVAILRIDMAADALKPLPLADRSVTLAAGDTVVALGYPAVSVNNSVVTESADRLSRAADVAVVPEVSVSQGIVSKVQSLAGPVGEQHQRVNRGGDTIEMSINSAGQGNSGGPVFDAQGRVIGIFSLVNTRGHATISGATPIRYGLELLEPARLDLARR
jgi:serine protease Do